MSRKIQEEIYRKRQACFITYSIKTLIKHVFILFYPHELLMNFLMYYSGTFILVFYCTAYSRSYITQLKSDLPVNQLSLLSARKIVTTVYIVKYIDSMHASLIISDHRKLGLVV